MNKIVGRYSLCAPVEGGLAFWVINDLEKMHSMVSIFKDFPNAKAEAERLFDELLKKTPPAQTGGTRKV